MSSGAGRASAGTATKPTPDPNPASIPRREIKKSPTAEAAGEGWRNLKGEADTGHLHIAETLAGGRFTYRRPPLSDHSLKRMPAMIWRSSIERPWGQIGRASCRERGCKHVWISGVPVTLKKKQ